MQYPNLSAGWASDFVNQQPIQTSAPLSAKGGEGSSHTAINARNVNVQHSIGPVGPLQGMCTTQAQRSHLLTIIPKGQVCSGNLAYKET
jgi:hypothetical protein